MASDSSGSRSKASASRNAKTMPDTITRQAIARRFSDSAQHNANRAVKPKI
jgi:hypothetical protein